MKIVGITGGIGSGKSTVCSFFSKWNIPVFISDIETKKIMNQNKDLKNILIQNFGKDTYTKDTLNTRYLSNIVFKKNDKLNLLNQIVHPFVEVQFEYWISKQNHNFIIKETAILFETGIYKNCDYVVTIVSDTQTRLQRTMQRNQLTENQIKQRMLNQWNDDKKIALSDFVIENNDSLEQLEKQTKQLYNKLILLF